jgi:hypothetical protein
MQFNPNMMSLNDLASISPMKDTAMGLLGSGLPGGARSDIMNQMPIGMVNREGQQFMGQQQTQMPQEGMSQGDMMKLAGMAMQGFNRGQQAPQAPTQQIMRDQNRFTYTQSPQQQMAQALRQRG